MKAIAGAGNPSSASIATEHNVLRRQKGIMLFLSCLIWTIISIHRRLWHTRLTLATARGHGATRYRPAVAGGAFLSSGVPSTLMYRLQPRQSRTSKPSPSSAEVTAYTSPQRHSWEKLPPSVSSKIISSRLTYHSHRTNRFYFRRPKPRRTR